MALYRGSRSNNTLNGSTGDDLFAGLGGNDTLNGGAGTDTAWYSGTLGGYHFSSDGPLLLVRDNLGSDGTDSLGQIEKLQFGNAQITVSPGEFRVNTFTDSSQVNPSITSLAGGGFVVSWQSFGQDGSGGRLCPAV